MILNIIMNIIINYTCFINGLIRFALFGKEREIELIKSGFGLGLDLTKGDGMA